MDGGADVAETSYTPFQSEPEAAPMRLIVRRVKLTLGSQLALFATYSYHGCITDREGRPLTGVGIGFLRWDMASNLQVELGFWPGFGQQPDAAPEAALEQQAPGSVPSIGVKARHPF